MELHRNAKLGLSGRFALVQAREHGLSIREVARRFSVSPATVWRWSCRWRAASEQERHSLVCLFDRSSRPRRMPRLLAASEQRRICAARRRTGWGPRLLTVRTGHAHSTISKVLKRHGLSRPPRAVRDPERRYEWPCPGDLLHMDVTLYGRFERPGHAVTGDRTALRPRNELASATTTRTRSSTITPGSPTPSFSRTSAPAPSPASSSERYAPSPPAGSSRND
jgi:transposase